MDVRQVPDKKLITVLIVPCEFATSIFSHVQTRPSIKPGDALTK